MLLESAPIRHMSPISGVSSLSSKYIATAGYDGRVILWDYEKKQPLSVVRHDHLVNDCRFSPNGKYLASSSSDYSSRIWSVPDLKLITILGDHSDDVEMSAFSDDSKYIATACRDNGVRVFDINGALIRHFQGHSRDVISVEWSGGNIISSSDDGTIRTWSFEGNSCKSVVELDGVETDTVVSINENVSISGNDNGEINIIRDNKIVRSERIFSSGIKKIIYSAEYQKILALSYDRTFALLEISRNESLAIVKRGEYPAVVWARSATIVNDEAMAFGTFGSSYAVYNTTRNDWDLGSISDTHGVNASYLLGHSHFTVGDSGVVKKNGRPYGDVGELCNFIVATENSTLVGGQSGAVFCLETKERVFLNDSPLNCCVHHQLDGEAFYILGDYGGNLIFLRELDGKIEFQKKTRVLKNAVKSLALADGLVFAVGASGDAALYSLSSSLIVFYNEKHHEKIINDCCRVGDSEFASVSRDLTLRIIDFFGNGCSIKTPHKNSIKCLSSDSSGRFIATGSYTGQLAIYDVKEAKWIEDKKISEYGLSSILYVPFECSFIITTYEGDTLKVLTGDLVQ